MANPARRSDPLALLWLTAVLVALVGGAVFLWSQEARRGSQNAEYSVARTDERGAAVVFRLFREAGLQPRVWDGELTGLRDPGLLVLLAPQQPVTVLRGQVQVGSHGDILPHEIEALDAWVRRGNVAVVMTRQPNDLFTALGLIVDEPKGVSGVAAEPAQPSLLARGVTELRTHTQFGFKFGRKKDPLLEQAGLKSPDPPIPLIPAEEWAELFVKRSGQRVMPQVVTAARGRGLYVAVNDVFPAGNLGITMGDNGRFMLNLARLAPPGGKIWFDEYHKREVGRSFLTYLRDRSLLPAVLYGVLLLALVFWRSGVRLGPADPLVPDERRDSIEYVRAVAQLYRSAGMTREALSVINDDFRRRLAAALRLSSLSDLDEVARRYEERTGRAGAEARRVLTEAEALQGRSGLPEADAVHFAARLSDADAALRGSQISGSEERGARG